ncbi:ficolin-2-like [Patiria miniata]|uniref:Fibrinogen C-terminal domain-containing protein n=1 Tax=Patiria miniata TaxID=46514 RepID=A0A914B0J8_PATMI|nr:ficolin-2-like [Patiria miniata]
MIDLDSRGCGQRMGRFVLPPGDPCTCTGVRLGGHYHRYAPEMQGQDPPLYMDMLPEVTAEVIGRWLNCTENKPVESTLGVTETAPELTSKVAPGSTPVASTPTDTTQVISITPEPSMPPADCQVILDAGQSASGVYTIRHAGQNMQVYCRMELGKGYIVFQRRLDGSVSFDRTWQEYAEGFGNLTGEFWLGNQKLRSLTRNWGRDMVINLRAFDGEEARIRYEDFNVDSSENKYKLFVRWFSEDGGDAGDSLWTHSNEDFSTLDKDHDDTVGENCAEKFHGGWWYKRCGSDISHRFVSNLNGLYYNNATVDDYMGIQWVTWKGDSLWTHSNEDFSTLDKDHDDTVGENCAEKFHGGWWYKRCGSDISHRFVSNLNGLYYNNATVDDYMGIQWVTWKGKAVSLKGCEMMTRPKW